MRAFDFRVVASVLTACVAIGSAVAPASGQVVRWRTGPIGGTPQDVLLGATIGSTTVAENGSISGPDLLRLAFDVDVKRRSIIRVSFSVSNVAVDYDRFTGAGTLFTTLGPAPGELDGFLVSGGTGDDDVEVFARFESALPDEGGRVEIKPFDEVGDTAFLRPFLLDVGSEGTFLNTNVLSSDIGMVYVRNGSLPAGFGVRSIGGPTAANLSIPASTNGSFLDGTVLDLSTADYDRDFDVDQADLTLFIDDVNSNVAIQRPDGATDIDENGATDFFDVIAFLRAFDEDVTP